MTSMNDILKGGRPKREPEHDGTRHASLPERDGPGSGVLAGVDRRPDGTPSSTVFPRIKIREKRKGNTRFYAPPEEPEPDDLRKLRAQAEKARREADETAERLSRRTS